MNRESEAVSVKSSAIEQWKILLHDDLALLTMPGAHHKSLLMHAHTLRQGQVIDDDDLSDLLELADAALAYAIESLLDLEADE